MKKTLLALFACLATAAHATTFSPIQLLNPSGSTSGQVIASTGPTTAPAWTTIAALGAAATASPLSQFAATTSAQLAGIISDETGTGSAVFGTAPTLNRPTINGVTSGVAAGSGVVGQIISTTSAATSVTSGTISAPVSESLPAGVWDVQVSATVTPAATTPLGAAIVGVSSSATAFNGSGTFIQTPAVTSTAGAPMTVTTPMVRQNISASTPFYGAVDINFATSTCTVTVTITARRVE
jgi:hypothetical protein